MPVVRCQVASRPRYRLSRPISSPVLISYSSFGYTQELERKQAAADRAASRDASKAASGSRRSAGASATPTGASDGGGDADDTDDEDQAEDEDEEVKIVGEQKKFRKRSTAACWKFFEKTNIKNESGSAMAKCKVEGCGALVTCTNTTNLTKHCQRHHLELWYMDVKSGKKVFLPAPPPTFSPVLFH